MHPYIGYQGTNDCRERRRRTAHRDAAVRGGLAIIGALATVAVWALPASAAPAMPSAGATPSSSHAQEPGVSVVPAFDTDLPTGSAGFTPASGATQAPDSPCRVYASDPSHIGSTIQGDGNSYCLSGSDTEVKVTVQQYRSFGIWSNKASKRAYSPGDYAAAKPIWECAAGTGNQLYRIVTDGVTVIGGRQFGSSTQSKNYLRVTCP